MKTISFFSEKGGVGKSSYSIMYASWLHHQHGLKVALADFNNRVYNYRRSEMANRRQFIESNPDTEIKPYDESLSWPIINCLSSDVREIRRNTGTNCPYANWFENEVSNGRLKGYDVVVLDFPGSLTGGEYLQMMAIGDIGLTVIPTEKDEMTLQSTLTLSRMLQNQDKKHCVFITKAQLGLRNFRGQYFKLAKLLVERGMPVLPDLVSYSERISTFDKVDIIRSTFGFPDFSTSEFEKGKDLGLENLFIDVTRELASTQDLKGTDEVNLDFINEMTKHNDGRQFNGSAFPEYEIKL